MAMNDNFIEGSDDILSYGEFAYIYDKLMNDVDYKKRATYLAALFSHYDDKTKTILDLACGTGSLSLELAKIGHEVIGVDISEDMLAVAEDKLSYFDEYDDGSFIKPMFICQDMRALDLYGTVNAAVSTLDSFNHIIADEEINRFLSRLKLFIEPGGLFIFDVNTVYKHRHVLANNNIVFENDNIFVTWCNQLDRESNIVEIFLDIFYENQDESYYRVSEIITERAYEIEEIKSFLENNQFELLDVFDDLTTEPPKQDSERVTIVARRVAFSS